MAFLNALAWTVGVAASILLVLKILFMLYYQFSRWGHIEKTLDMLAGKQIHISVTKESIVALICWLWIIYGGK